MEIEPNEAAALTRAISPDRLATFNTTAQPTSTSALELYLWNRDLAMAILADVAILEVALRNALHDRLALTFGGPYWFTQASSIGLDNRSQKSIMRAERSLPTAGRTPGRVVAQLMFGFWTGLLDAGDGAHDHDRDLWRPTLSRAFPGGSPEARAARRDGDAAAAFTRSWVHSTVSVINALRNRAAHHEPLLTGFPLPGQFDSQGKPIRRTTSDGHAACLRLARLLDRDLASWLTSNSTVPSVLRARP